MRGGAMALYLVQHGKCLPEEIDHNRPLSEQGRATVVHVAQVAAEYGVPVSVIRHRGKPRARHTADIMTSVLKPAHGVHVSEGLTPHDDVTAFAVMCAGHEDVMLVGHLPFLDRLVSYLTTGSTVHTLFRFQNGGIVCLDRDDDAGRWYIKWPLSPEIG